MITRSAIFEGEILQGKEEEFYAAVEERLLPAWKGMLHAINVRLYRPTAQDPDTRPIFLVQEIDYPSREALAEALQAPQREIAKAALESVQPMYRGRHYHYVYDILG